MGVAAEHVTGAVLDRQRDLTAVRPLIPAAYLPLDLVLDRSLAGGQISSGRGRPARAS